MVLEALTLIAPVFATFKVLVPPLIVAVAPDSIFTAELIFENEAVLGPKKLALPLTVNELWVPLEFKLPTIVELSIDIPVALFDRFVIPPDMLITVPVTNDKPLINVFVFPDWTTTDPVCIVFVEVLIFKVEFGALISFID